MGTNPLTIGLPTDEDFDFLIDCATSITQRGKIEYFARVGKDTPAGMVIGEDGTAKTDSVQILEDLVAGKAALAPLGGIGDELAGYKGYGYAAAIEILSAALSAGSYMKMLTGVAEDGSKRPIPLGHFFIAADTEAFMGQESFRKTAGNILRELRASKKAPGHDRIFTAGEQSYARRLARAAGDPITEGAQKELISIRDELGLTQYRFPFED